jgi:hypothetical protein
MLVWQLWSFLYFIWILFEWDSNLNSKFKFESYVYKVWEIGKQLGAVWALSRFVKFSRGPWSRRRPAKPTGLPDLSAHRSPATTYRRLESPPCGPQSSTSFLTCSSSPFLPWRTRRAIADGAVGHRARSAPSDAHRVALGADAEDLHRPPTPPNPSRTPYKSPSTRPCLCSDAALGHFPLSTAREEEKKGGE